MEISELKLGSKDYPEQLATIASPPKILYCLGKPLKELMRRPRVAIVGTRKISRYGRQVTTRLASDLANQGIVIVSGLAFGVDILAHQTTLEVGGTALAVLPGPLDNILPASNRQLAEKIIAQGGTLVSEKPPGSPVFQNDFVARNRIVSGLARAVVITEAQEGSGTFHTATFALEQDRDLFVVPGNIDAPGSRGANEILKRDGARVITSYLDILIALDLIDHATPAKQIRGRNPQEQALLELLLNGISEGEQLQEASGLNIAQFNQTLTMLEVSGKIRPLGGNQWAIT